jgi:hypothetical protein
LHWIGLVDLSLPLKSVFSSVLKITFKLRTIGAVLSGETGYKPHFLSDIEPVPKQGKEGTAGLQKWYGIK